MLAVLILREDLAVCAYAHEYLKTFVYLYILLGVTGIQVGVVFRIQRLSNYFRWVNRGRQGIAWHVQVLGAGLGMAQHIEVRQNRVYAERTSP